MKRVLLSLLFATLAGALVFGAAANLPVTAQDLGAGRDAVTSCDETDGVDVSFTWDVNDPAVITAIKVADIHIECDDLTVYVSVLDDTPTSIYNSNAVYDADTATVAGELDFTGLSLDASAVYDVAITIAG